MSFRFQILLVALVVAGAALVTRSAFAAGLALSAALVNAMVLAPLYTDDPPEARGVARIELAHVNMQREPGDLGELERALDERKPDVFVVLEPSLAWLVALDSGIAGYRTVSGRRGPVVVLARTELQGVVAPTEPGLPTTLQFDVRLGATTVHVLAVHTLAPSTPRRRDVRDRELAAVALWAERTPGSKVVIGDLNAVPWSRAHERLRSATDLRSSAHGAGYQASWPSLAGPLGVPIDDLLYSDGLTVTDRDTGPSFGSDHRSLWVTIALS